MASTEDAVVGVSTVGVPITTVASGAAQVPGDGAPPRIRVRGLTKRYGPLAANDGIDLDVARGGIHAVVGENGAGKTTLMRILYGLVQPDAGSVALDGAVVRMSSPADAIRRGIGMVHQRFELVESLSALENLVLGSTPHRGPFVDRPAALGRARELATMLGTSLDWDRPVGSLSVGTRQRLEIMRLLYRDADILIFDEPTSVLTPQEADELFGILRRLAGGGHTILFVSHKLREVFAVADRVTVMRRGRVVGTYPVAATDPQAIAALMVGERLEQPALPRETAAGATVLEVRGLEVADDLGFLALREASFSIRAGEIVGVAGVEGSGQRELVECVTGLRAPTRGQVLFLGQSVSDLPVAARRAQGLAFISEDRDAEGACLQASISDNAFALRRNDAALAPGGRLRRPAIRSFVAQLLERFGVQGGGPDAPARALSGGNLQRLVVGRELHEIPRLLVAAHPTRGVDVRGITFIHRQILEARAAGAAILLISEELSELLMLADRVVVLFNGRLVAELAAADATAERLGQLMTGAAA